jgi:hypothetical protein
LRSVALASAKVCVDNGSFRVRLRYPELRECYKSLPQSEQTSGSVFRLTGLEAFGSAWDLLSIKDRVLESTQSCMRFDCGHRGTALNFTESVLKTSLKLMLLALVCFASSAASASALEFSITSNAIARVSEPASLVFFGAVLLIVAGAGRRASKAR